MSARTRSRWATFRASRFVADLPLIIITITLLVGVFIAGHTEPTP